MAHRRIRRWRTGEQAARALVLICALGLLTGCAGENVFSMFGPKEPDVPQAPSGQFPNLSTPIPEVPRPPVLDAKGQAQMESDLEALAKQTLEKGEAAAREAP